MSLLFRNHRQLISHFLNLALLTTLIVIFFWPTLVKGQLYSIGGMMGSDLVLTDLPSFKIYKESLESLSLPWWISGIGNGYPLVAGAVLGAFYPSNLILFKLLPIHLAIDWSILLHICIAATGMYFLVFSFTKIRLAAIYSGLIFALSGYMVSQIPLGNLLLTISLYPWIFFCFWNLTEKFKLSKLVVLSLLFLLQLLSGYLPIAYYGWVMLIFTAILRAKFVGKKILINLGILVIAIVLSLGLACVQLIPTAELTTLSTRSKIDYQEATFFIYPKEAFLTFLGIKYPLEAKVEISQGRQVYYQIKSFNSYYSYIGLTAIFLIVFGFWWSLKEAKNFPIVILATISLFMSLGHATPFFGWVWHIIPGMNYFRYSIYFLGFLVFFLSLLAGFGIAVIQQNLNSFKKNLFSNQNTSQLLESERPRSRRLAAGMNGSQKNLPEGILRSLLRSSSLTKLSLVVIITITFIDLYIHNNNIQPTKLSTFWLQNPEIVEKISQDIGYSRIVSFSSPYLNDWTYINDWPLQFFLRNYLPANYNLLFNIASVGTREPIHLVLQGAFEDFTLPLVSLEILKQKDNQSQINFPIELPVGLYQIYQAQGVKFIFSLIPLSDPRLKLYWQRALPHQIELNILGNLGNGFDRLKLRMSHIFVYQIINNLPRASFIKEADLVKSQQAILDQISVDNFNPETKVLIEGEKSNSFVGEKGTAAIIKDEGSYLKISFSSNKGGWLYLSDTYYPGWKAYIDGVETKIYKANYAFRAIKVTQPGKHTVEFIYDPMSRKIGIGISLVSILILFIVFINRKEIEDKLEKLINNLVNLK